MTDAEDLDIGVAPAVTVDGSNPGLADINVLVMAYADSRVAREAAEEHAKQLRRAEEAIEVQLFDLMEKMNLRSVQHARGRFSLNDLAWPVTEDADAAREWAKIAQPDLLLLNNQRLAVIVREALRGERDMPPGVDFRTSRKISWRRT